VGEMCIFGGEEVEVVSIEEEKWECAMELFSKARLRRARAFLGFDRR